MADTRVLGDYPGMNDLTPFAERLRAIMDARGLKPAPLGRDAGVGIDYIRDVLRGRVRRPSGEKLKKLADYLEMSVDTLLDEDAPVEIAAQPSFAEADATPWQPAAASKSADGLAQLVQLIAPKARTPSLMRARQTLLSFGIFAGDILVVDASPDSARPCDLVLVNHVDFETGSGRTLIRRYFPPYLASPEGSGEAPLLADGHQNVIMGRVAGVVRGPEMEG